jgi:YfiH family protein
LDPREGRLTNPVLLFAENLRKAGIPHAFTTRQGGISPPPYDSLNLGRGVDDDPQNVAHNRSAVLNALGLGPARDVEATQVHGTTIEVVIAADAGRVIEGADGMATSERHLTLAVHAADCVPVLLADPRHRAVAAVHAGWKGTGAGIAVEAVRVLADRFGTRPRDILVAIGPSIRGCHYEVDEPVYTHYRPWSWRDAVFTPNQRERWQLDLQAANRHQLLDAGVPPAQIETIELCTFDRPNQFFSYRRERKTGRMAGIIAVS